MFIPAVFYVFVSLLLLFSLVSLYGYYLLLLFVLSLIGMGVSIYSVLKFGGLKEEFVQNNEDLFPAWFIEQDVI